jgi:hypothetical protein
MQLDFKYERLIKYVQNKTKLHLNFRLFFRLLSSLLCMWSMFNWMGEDADIFQGFLLLFLIYINCKKLGFPANFILFCSEIFPIINKSILKFTVTVTIQCRVEIQTNCQNRFDNNICRFMKKVLSAIFGCIQRMFIGISGLNMNMLNF